MAQRQLEVRGSSEESADDVWAIAGQFLANWHPAIESVTAERDAHGAQIRAFTVYGEDTLYREQLIYYSDADRELRYAHLQGIADVDQYVGSLRVEAGEHGGCTIVCSATVVAAEARAEQIVNGTRAIFQSGIDALIACSDESDRTHPGAGPIDDSQSLLETVVVAGTPELACTAAVNSAGPLCIFLHGIGGARHNWQTQLAAAGLRVPAVAMDLRGYGDSEAGSHQSIIDDYCNDILRVREAFDSTEIILCGLSYGAWIATSFAMRHPQMLRGLVLSGGCTGMSEASAAERESFRKSRELPLNAGQTPADFASDVVDIISGPQASDENRRLLLESMSAISASTYRDAINCFTRPAERFDFSKLTMPVLMMTGEHDRLAPPTEIRNVAARIGSAVLEQRKVLPDVQFEVIAAAGHVCNLENPSEYNRVLMAFLSRVSS